MSSISGSTDSTSADYLNALRKELAKSKAKAVNSTALLEYILDFYNQINISNAVSLNNNKLEFANQINLTNALARTDQLTETFLIDTAKTDFSDISSGITIFSLLLSDGTSTILLDDGTSEILGRTVV